MSRLYQRALAIGWAVVALTGVICLPLRLVEIHAAHGSTAAQRAVAGDQPRALPHVRLARAQD